MAGKKKKRTSVYATLINEQRVTQGALAQLVEDLQLLRQEVALLTHALDLHTQQSHSIRISLTDFHTAVEKLTRSLPLPVSVEIQCPSCRDADLGRDESEPQYDFEPPLRHEDIADDAADIPPPQYHVA